jgi:hypothetical protein
MNSLILSCATFSPDSSRSAWGSDPSEPEQPPADTEMMAAPIKGKIVAITARILPDRVMGKLLG